MFREKENPKGLLYGRACSVCKKSDNKHLREFKYLCKPCQLGKKAKEQQRILAKKRKNSLYYNRKKVIEHQKECYFCKSKQLLHTHHLDKNRNNNSLDNLMVLCLRCHFLVHKQMRSLDKFEEAEFRKNYFVYKKLCLSEHSFLQKIYPLREEK